MSETPFFSTDSLVRQTIAADDTNADFKYIERRQKLFFQDGGAGDMEQFPLSSMAVKAKMPASEAGKILWGGVSYDNRNFEIAGVYSDTDLSALIAPGASTTSSAAGGVMRGATVYVKPVAVDGEEGGDGITNLKRLRKNMQLEITDIANHKSVYLHVYSLTFTGGAPYATCILKTTDPAPGGVAVLSSEDETTQNLWGSLGATSQVEGDKFHGGALKEPTEWYNYTQIMSEPVEFTGSEISDKSVWGQSNLVLRRLQARWEFKNQLEDAIRFGIRIGPDDDGSTGLGRGYMPTLRDGESVQGKMQSMGGIKWLLNNYELDSSGDPKNILSVPDTTTFNGVNYTNMPWDYSGRDYILNLLSYAGKTGPTKRLGLVGNKAMFAIERACESHGQLTLSTWTDSPVGFRVRELRGGKITLMLKEDEKFSNNLAHERDLWIVPEGLLKYQAKIGRDMTYIRAAQLDRKGAPPDKVDDLAYWRDAGMEGFWGEGSVVVDNLPAFLIVSGIGEAFATG